ncbi:peroxiredoxin [Alistipes sp.]|uniref:peroxiredoxin family protein n=1 Tax=Alistipes sp. TaxID=1872444 RepID=UPI0025C66726|nr:TlpA disulfide reductase family protein [Alistipes sp.]
MQAIGRCFHRVMARGLVLAVLLSGACIGEDEPSPGATSRVRVGDMAPDFAVGMFDGGQTRLSELRGNVVLLVFFASWCPECRRELGAVPAEVLQRFAGRKFVLLAVSRGESRDELAAFREESGLGFPMGLDPDGAIYGLYAGRTVPRNYLLDAGGRVAALSAGYDAAEFRNMLALAENLLPEEGE